MGASTESMDPHTVQDLSMDDDGNWNLEWEGPFLPAFSYVLRSKNGLLLSHTVLLQCSSLEALKACVEACPDVFSSNFHGLATLKFKTCVETWVSTLFLQFFWFAAISTILNSNKAAQAPTTSSSATGASTIVLYT